MLDAVWGFNHIRNTKRAMKRLAFISLTGVYLPVCLPFGPVNGPEDFQRMMHKIFKAKLFKEWFIFLDDVAVATGMNHHMTAKEKADYEKRKAYLSRSGWKDLEKYGAYNRAIKLKDRQKVRDAMLTTGGADSPACV